MTPRERVEKALAGGHSDSVPFTMYEYLAPQCTTERELRNRGMCIVKRDVPVFKTIQPNVKVTREVYREGERQFVRTYYETPAGTLTDLTEPAGFTVWNHQPMFKGPEDYKAILFFFKDEQYQPAYESFAAAEKSFGEDAIFRAGFGLEPLQTLISGGIMDMQTFCAEWMDNRDEILRIYDAIVANRRRIYPLVSESPALHANYGGNVVPEIIGPETFEKYYVPHYNEAAEIMHRRGKLIGCHFDANCRALAQAIAGTQLDYVEAFTPEPDTDMTLGEAKDAWPDKVIWLNFPSSVHLKTNAEVKKTAIDLLNQLKAVDGLIMGVTEDIPPERWQESCRAIMDGLEEHAAMKPDLYK